jgi:hypothetical protein
MTGVIPASAMTHSSVLTDETVRLMVGSEIFLYPVRELVPYLTRQQSDANIDVTPGRRLIM